MSGPRVIVAGLGVMGAAIAAELARRGARVDAFDRHRPPHALGSSHGGSRIIRRAYFEGPQYVPLVERAYPLWRRLERRGGRRLLIPSGGLTVGRPEGALVRQAAEAAAAYGVEHEVLDAAEVGRRFPAFRPAPEEVAVWDPAAGVLRPEAAIESLLEDAAAGGVALHYEEAVLGWREVTGEVEVTTASGRHRADLLVLAAGAWMPELLGGDLPVLEVERVVQHWFAPGDRPHRLRPPSCPVWVWESEPGRIWYGLPDVGDGLKAALHYQGTRGPVDSVDRRVRPEEAKRVVELLERYLPEAAGPPLRSEVCLYTVTPDLDFLLDRHPASRSVYVASPCSGHGFKFAPALAEAIAGELIDDRRSPALEPFRAARLVDGPEG